MADVASTESVPARLAEIRSYHRTGFEVGAQRVLDGDLDDFIRYCLNKIAASSAG
jgi:hypothetical protein